MRPIAPRWHEYINPTGDQIAVPRGRYTSGPRLLGITSKLGFDLPDW
jgi:hypothetical protein